MSCQMSFPDRFHLMNNLGFKPVDSMVQPFFGQPKTKKLEMVSELGHWFFLFSDDPWIVMRSSNNALF